MNFLFGWELTKPLWLQVTAQQGYGNFAGLGLCPMFGLEELIGYPRRPCVLGFYARQKKDPVYSRVD